MAIAADISGHTVRPVGAPALRLGFVPLTDAAPLLVAEERGYFREHGVAVALEPVNSWAALRDKTVFGRLDGGQMLAPMPIAAAIGLGGVQAPLVVASTLGLNGNTITLGPGLWRDIEEAAPDLAALRPLPAAALAAALIARRNLGRPQPVFAVVYPFSSHNYLLRYWLQGGGIDPDEDVCLTVMPPPLVADYLADGAIDGFCAGEPWGSRAVDLRVGRIALTTADIWRDHPEKVLAFTASETQRNPGRVAAATAAIMAAGRWLDAPENHAAAARILCDRTLLNVPPSVVAMALRGRLVMAPDEAETAVIPPRFHAGGASFPFPQHGRWWLSQMQRWRHVPADTDPSIIGGIWRPDLWRAAGRLIGETAPEDVSPIAMPPAEAAADGGPPLRPWSWKPGSAGG
jgi:ABC-type nitrate/sulfonate/bicarbonate transport system substrate-binding protein